MEQPAKVVKFEDLAVHTQAQTAMSEEQYFRVRTHVIANGTWAGLSPSAKAIYPVIAWKTTGFEKESDKISHTQLMELSGVKRAETIGAAVKELVELGLIEVSQKKGAITNYKLGKQVRINRTTENETSTDNPLRLNRTTTDKPVRLNRSTLPKTSTDNPYTTTYLPTLLTYTLRGWVEKSEFEKPKPQSTNGKFQMFVGWLPNDAGQQLLKMRKVDLSLPEHSEVFADFLAYWATQDTERTEAEWNKTLLRDFSTGAKARRAGYSKTVEASKKKPSVRDVPVHTEGGVLTGW